MTRPQVSRDVVLTIRGVSEDDASFLENLLFRYVAELEGLESRPCFSVAVLDSGGTSGGDK